MRRDEIRAPSIPAAGGVTAPGGKGAGPPLDYAALLGECADYLREVLASRPSGRQQRNGIAAAAHLANICRRELDRMDPVKLLVALLGDKRKAVEWMRAVIPVLEQEIALGEQVCMLEADARAKELDDELGAQDADDDAGASAEGP